MLEIFKVIGQGDGANKAVGHIFAFLGSKEYGEGLLLYARLDHVVL